MLVNHPKIVIIACHGMKFVMHRKQGRSLQSRPLACTYLTVQSVSAVQVNDSLGETQLCLRFSPLEVAAGCLHLASTILGVAERLPHSKQLGWWGAIGVEQRAIEEVAHCLCDAAKAREQLKGAASPPLT